MAETVNNPTNVRLGRVRLYYAPTNTADPVDTAFGSSPPGPWTYVGWMEAASAILSTAGVLELLVDDFVTAVDNVINNRAAGIDGSIAEYLMANIQFVNGGTLSSVAASSGHAGYDKLVIHGSDDVNHKAIMAEQLDPREVIAGTSLPVTRLRIFFPYATIMPNGNQEWSRKRQLAIPFSIRGHIALDGSELLSTMYKFTAVGT